MTNPIPLCPSIDVGLFLNTDGQVKTCCAGNKSFGNIKKQSLDEIFSTSDHYINSKTLLDKQEWPPYCNGCVAHEKNAPGTSQLTYFNRNFKTTGVRQTKQIDLRWSNVCNLSCRYCDPGASSVWEQMLGQKPQSANREYHQSVLDDVRKNADYIETAFMLGGEPLMQKQNEQLLEILNPNTQIDIITNLSTRLENNKIYNLLKKQERVSWHISFENIGDRFEYVRAGADWELLQHNIEVLKNDFGVNSVQFHPVYGIWSATRLVEFYDFVDLHGVGVGWQMANPSWGKYGCDYFSIFDHDPRIKELAIKQIDSIPNLFEREPSFKGIRENLSTDTFKPEASKEFLSWTARIEEFMPPKVGFADLWPELYEVMK